MKSAESGRLRVRVVYLRPGLSFERNVVLPDPSVIADALAASEVRRQVPELALGQLDVGVFGQRRSLADALYDGDRVEIYRPLTIDPKQARRIRATVRRRRSGHTSPSR